MPSATPPSSATRKYVTMFSIGVIACVEKFGFWRCAGSSRNSMTVNAIGSLESPIGGRKKISIPTTTAPADHVTRVRSSMR